MHQIITHKNFKLPVFNLCITKLIGVCYYPYSQLGSN
jgi:hypothetical protein